MAPRFDLHSTASNTAWPSVCMNLNPAVGWPKETKDAERKEVLRQPPFIL